MVLTTRPRSPRRAKLSSARQIISKRSNRSWTNRSWTNRAVRVISAWLSRPTLSLHGVLLCHSQLRRVCSLCAGAISSAAHLTRRTGGQFFFRQSDPASDYFVVEQGHVRLTHLTSDGAELTIQL